MGVSGEFYDVIIVGGGVIGCSTAWHLLGRSDFDGRVLVIEKGEFVHESPRAGIDEKKVSAFLSV